jgi:hypothetical protein
MLLLRLWYEEVREAGLEGFLYCEVSNSRWYDVCVYVSVLEAYAEFTVESLMIMCACTT